MSTQNCICFAFLFLFFVVTNKKQIYKLFAYLYFSGRHQSRSFATFVVCLAIKSYSTDAALN